MFRNISLMEWKWSGKENHSVLPIFLACIWRDALIVFRAMLLELSKPLHLDPTHIPCLADNKFSAKGDRGGPLVYNSSGKAVVLGVKASDSLHR
ncbi:hypothetical protein L3Y34_002986 [Caenorhabditis briggsae]|uniref:Uncharacterized protein n=1 Tax=Caenorhabditis briggsae TaxID=6238 RepID=A0AAE9A8A8_CAEBR|nr:hypothetical protein L3Y34_002986 [Caenorhabditis briggsae]